MSVPVLLGLEAQKRNRTHTHTHTDVDMARRNVTLHSDLITDVSLSDNDTDSGIGEDISLPSDYDSVPVDCSPPSTHWQGWCWGQKAYCSSDVDSVVQVERPQ